MSVEIWERMSYVVTVVGLPLAIFVFLFEQRKKRENEEEEVYQLFSDNYQDFLKVALDALNAEQKERQLIIFNMLLSLFERAYLLVYDENMSPKQAQRWNSFRASLPALLHGEDPGFVRYVERLHAQAERK